MDDYVQNLNLKHLNESNRHVCKGINMASLCYRNIGWVESHSLSRVYGPFRYYRVKLYQYIYEKIDEILESIRLGIRLPGNDFFSGIDIAVVMFGKYVHFCEPSPAEFDYFTQMRNVMRSQYLCPVRRIDDLSAVHYAVPAHDVPTDNSPGCYCSIYLPSDPENYMRVRIRYLLFNRAIGPQFVVKKFQSDFKHVQSYLRCYPDANKTMEIFNRVASRLLAFTDISAEDRVQAARSLFDQPIPNYDMAGAVQREASLRRVLEYMGLFPHLDCDSTMTVVNGEPTIPNVWRGMIRDFWQRKRDSDGNEIFHLDLPSYFREVLIRILCDVENLGRPGVLDQMDPLMSFCTNLSKFRSGNLQTSVQDTSVFFDHYLRMMVSLDGEKSRFDMYALWNFCLEQKYDLDS